ncbi:MAG TPA: M28 family peptidase [Stellaceae bacterium]|nr:M28 family peptidase [Stellaceae bacterium]
MRRALGILALALALAAVAPARAAEVDLSIWRGERAMEDIAKQLSFGVRAIGSPGHEKTAAYIEQELAKLSLPTQRQSWTEVTGEAILPLANVVGRFAPENPRRVIVGTHYDSIVRAYRDREHPDAPMPGANNSASGVAVLLETARVLSQSFVRPAVGVDFVFFDGEEGPVSLGEGDPHWVPLGSPYFANNLAGLYGRGKPSEAVIFDMVCYEKLKLQPEPVSLTGARAQVQEFWRIGSELAPTVFSTTPTQSPIYDDHLPLNQAGIPSFLVIGFEYEPWYNTTRDTLDKCSTASLEAVGRTLTRYLYQVGKSGR